MSTLLQEERLQESMRGTAGSRVEGVYQASTNSILDPCEMAVVTLLNIVSQYVGLAFARAFYIRIWHLDLNQGMTGCEQAHVLCRHAASARQGRSGLDQVIQLHTYWALITFLAWLHPVMNKPCGSRDCLYFGSHGTKAKCHRLTDCATAGQEVSHAASVRLGHTGLDQVRCSCVQSNMMAGVLDKTSCSVVHT